MEVKLLEVRDSMTFIPMLAIKPIPRSEEERYLLARAGYGSDPKIQSAFVFLCRLDGGPMNYDAYAWGHLSRTCGTVHDWLGDHWAEVKSGDVLDVEYILGETSVPKVSERVDMTTR